MNYKVKLTVIDKKLYPELQRQYCAVGYIGGEPPKARSAEAAEFFG